ncbi:hypothetical protein [Acinetobacter baumannii]
MELELSAGVLDRQIDNLKAEIAEEYSDDEKLELLIEYAMKLGEVYAQRDLLEKAKAQAVPNEIINEIQSWIAVQSTQAMELDGEEFVVGANELAEFIENLVKSESGAEG